MDEIRIKVRRSSFHQDLFTRETLKVQMSPGTLKYGHSELYYHPGILLYLNM